MPLNKKTKQYTVEKLYNIVLKICHSVQIPLYRNQRGSKKFTAHQKVALLVLKARSGLSLRRFVDWLYETKWPEWLNLPEIPSHMTIHRALKSFSLPSLRAIALAIALLGKKAKTLAIDATGIDSTYRSRHYEKRVGFGCTPYVKLDAMINTNDLMFHDFVCRMKPRHDVLGARTILKRAKHKDVLILGDKGYDSRELCCLAEERGNRLFAPVRQRERGRIYGRHRRENAKGHEESGKRSLVECAFSIVKRCYNNHVRSRLHHMKKRELAWTIIAYNMDRLVKMMQVLLHLLFRTRYRAGGIAL